MASAYYLLVVLCDAAQSSDYKTQLYLAGNELPPIIANRNSM
jgi:hypothetical protein